MLGFLSVVGCDVVVNIGLCGLVGTDTCLTVVLGDVVRDFDLMTAVHLCVAKNAMGIIAFSQVVGHSCIGAFGDVYAVEGIACGFVVGEGDVTTMADVDACATGRCVETAVLHGDGTGSGDEQVVLLAGSWNNAGTAVAEVAGCNGDAFGPSNGDTVEGAILYGKMFKMQIRHLVGTLGGKGDACTGWCVGI